MWVEIASSTIAGDQDLVEMVVFILLQPQIIREFALVILHVMSVLPNYSDVFLL